MHVCEAHLNSTNVLWRISKKREVRYWFSAFGQLVGVWRSPTGKKYAVGHNPAGKVIVYRTGNSW